MRLWPALGLVLALLLTAPGGAQTTGGGLETSQISAAEARELGLTAIQNQRPDIALQIAQALLANDPEDPFAHFLIASALSALNRMPEAQAAGKQAFRHAQTPEQKFQAARITALAAFNQKRFGAAQWWLRRTISAAPDAARRARTLQEFASVRGMNPLAVALRFAAVPSDNVNGGSSGSFNTIDGVPITGILSPDALALSGVIFDASLDLRYRMRETATGSTSLGVLAVGQAVRLSRSAKAKLGAVAVPKLGSQRIEVSLRQVYAPAGAKYKLNVAATFGRIWQRSLDPQDLGRVTLGYDAIIGKSNLLDISAVAEQRSATGTNPRGDRIYILRGSLTHQLPNADLITGSLYFSGYDTARAGQSSDTLGLQLGYDPARDFGPLRLGVSVGLQVAQFDGYTLAGIVVPGGRRDKQIFAELRLLFRKIEYAGFAPQLSLRQQTTLSNVSRFDTRATSVTLGIISTF